LRGFPLQIDEAEIAAHEAGDPNAFVDVFDCAPLAGADGRDVGAFSMQADSTARRQTPCVHDAPRARLATIPRHRLAGLRLEDRAVAGAGVVSAPRAPEKKTAPALQRGLKGIAAAGLGGKIGACKLMIALKCGGIMLLSRRNWAARARPIELLRLRRVVRRRCERRIDLEASAQGQKKPAVSAGGSGLKCFNARCVRSAYG
jgi:hypothetical protein